MDNISLLPPEIRTRQEAHRKRRVYLLAGGAVLAVFLMVYGILFTVTMYARGEIKELAAKRTALEQQIAELDVYAAMQDRVVENEKLVQQAVGTVPEWETVLSGVGLCIPEGVWLTDFMVTYKSDDKAGALTLRGGAFNHVLVGEWLDRLREAPGLTNVRCRFSNEQSEGAVSFEIEAVVLPGDPALPADGGGV